MKALVMIPLAFVVAALAALAYVYSGLFDASADNPHGVLLSWLARTTRERSIEVRSKDIEVPNLGDAARIAAGADEYAQMCAGCHLAPGVTDNEFRRGLYPPAPELAKLAPAHADRAASAARQFWIVKHGIKMSAMPAWGLTHDDATLWSIVAFVQKLPELTADQYRDMTADSASAHTEAGHEHAAAEP